MNECEWVPTAADELWEVAKIFPAAKSFFERCFVFEVIFRSTNADVFQVSSSCHKLLLLFPEPWFEVYQIAFYVIPCTWSAVQEKLAVKCYCQITIPMHNFFQLQFNGWKSEFFWEALEHSCFIRCIYSKVKCNAAFAYIFFKNKFLLIFNVWN